jgi:hypothetical protein
MPQTLMNVLTFVEMSAVDGNYCTITSIFLFEHLVM